MTLSTPVTASQLHTVVAAVAGSDSPEHATYFAQEARLGYARFMSVARWAQRTVHLRVKWLVNAGSSITCNSDIIKWDVMVGRCGTEGCMDRRRPDGPTLPSELIGNVNLTWTRNFPKKKGNKGRKRERKRREAPRTWRMVGEGLLAQHGPCSTRDDGKAAHDDSPRCGPVTSGSVKGSDCVFQPKVFFVF